MNERIKELERQATETVKCGLNGTSTTESFNRKKFAELIVRECAKSLWTEECRNSDLALEEFEKNSKKILEHFGVINERL
jgi:hypothetical protein